MKKKKTIILIFVFLIIITCLVIGYLYFATDTFKSNKELFFKYLSNTKLIESEITNKYKNLYESEIKSNFSSNGNIICSTVSNVNTTNVADIKQLFNIKYNRLKNNNLKQSYSDFTLNANNEDLMTVRFLKDSETYGIKIENVLKKYLAVENNNLKDFCSKFGISDLENVPDSISVYSLQKLLKFDENQLNAIKSTYGKIFLNNLTEKNFTKIKNKDDTITIKLTLTERETVNIVKQEIEALYNDNNTLNIIVNKLNEVGYSTNTEILKENIQKILTKINSNINNITDKQFLNISIKGNKNSTLRINLLMYSDKNEKDKDGNNIKEEYELSIDMTQKNKRVIVLRENENVFEIDMLYGYENDKMWENINILSVDNQTQLRKNIGKLKHQTFFKDNNIVQDFTINIEQFDKLKQKFQIDISDSKEIKQDIQIEKITNENAAILNNKTKEEIQNILSAVILRIQFLYGNKMENIISSIQ